MLYGLTERRKHIDAVVAGGYWLYGTSMDENARHAALVSAHRKTLLRLTAGITGYYAVLAAVLAVSIWAFPGIVDEFPLGGVGDIANYNSENLFGLEEAMLSADNEELEQIASDSAKARMTSAPAWLSGAISLVYAMTAT